MKASALWLTFFLLPGSASATGEAEFTRILDLPGGDTFCQAYGISADGSTVVGYAYSESGQEAFAWSKETGMIALGDLPGGEFRSWAWSASGDGSIITGWGSTQAGRKAFRWTAASGLEELPSLHGASGQSQARDISDDGMIIVGISGVGDGERGFRWSDGEMTLIADEARWGFATSADGRAIVGRGIFDYWLEPYLWTPETGAFSLRPTPNSSVASAAYGISADGEVVVRVHDRRAFRWSAATGFASLGSIGFRSSVAGDASGDGSIIVGEVENRAFIWDEDSGMRYLSDVLELEYGVDLTDYILVNATAISNDGRTIAGYGAAVAGRSECWVVRLPSACSDGRDNDDDGTVDDDDLGCLSPEDDSEALRSDVSMQILPQRDLNVISVGAPQSSSRPLRVAILGSSEVDLQGLDRESLIAGPEAATPSAQFKAKFKDVDHDGHLDYEVAFPVAALALAPGDEELCVAGDLDGITFRACDAVQVVLFGCGVGFETAPGLALVWLLPALRRKRWPTAHPATRGRPEESP